MRKAHGRPFIPVRLLQEVQRVAIMFSLETFLDASP